MKKKILIIVYIILICITLKLLYNITINSILINRYNNGEYSESQAKALKFLNFNQSYVANYNYGNILYQNGKYEDAQKEYRNALDGIVPKNKECNIRINYALAICKTVSVNEEEQSSINSAIEKYESAIEILIQKGCANKNDNNGHNQKAEKLKNDIQNEIDRLKNLQKDNNNNNEQEKEEKKQKNIDTIKEEMKNIKENATQEQREMESQYKNYGNYDYNRVEKNW